MPRLLAATEFRREDISTSLNLALTLLNELNDAFAPPFMQTICNTAQSLITAVQNVKRNKDECFKLTENIHEVLHAIINLGINSEPVGSIPPSDLYHLGKFAETLRKIHTYVDAQQDGRRFKHLFRHNEMNSLLKDCRAGLEEALNVFNINTPTRIFSSIDEMKKTTEIMHRQLLELISTLSEGSISDRSSSVYLGAYGLKNSSTSLMMLPSNPKIFHGRESEIDDILNILGQEAPRIAILGGGGMGKTTLARAALHHPDVSSRFEQRFFVSAESATTSIELAGLIGLHIGLNPGQDLTKPVIHYFSKQSLCLLVLDNLETVWEPIQTRDGIERFLSLLTDLDHVALMITMRGAERPAQVRWTHPFLLPLKPLSNNAARQTFIEITDNSHDIEDVNKLLQFTDNMPLAVDLIAHLADYEGCSNVLIRWETERTSLLCAGDDKKSNLDKSIALSLSSPRITTGSKELLSLLSILPDGLSDVELLQSNLPIQNILKCKAILLVTSLAYQDNKRRLRSLIPIREYVQCHYPPSSFLIQSLCKYFHLLLELYKKYNGEQLQPIPCHPRLEASCLIEALLSYKKHPTLPTEQLIAQTTTKFLQINDLALESRFHWAAGMYYDYEYDPSRSMSFFEEALKLSMLCGDINQQCNALLGIARVKVRTGDHSGVKAHTSEVQRLSKLSANLYQEARALWIEALCDTTLGNYQNSVACLHTAQHILGLCGLSGGSLDYNIRICQADVHLRKSEYTQARNIHFEMAETTSNDPTAEGYALALLNIAQVDVIIGASGQDIRKGLDDARSVFNTFNLPPLITGCDMVLADLELREGSFVSARTLLHTCIQSTLGSDIETMLYCLERLADISRWSTSGFHWEFPLLVVYLVHAYQLKEKLALHKGLLFLGDVFILTKHNETAHSLFTAALMGFTYMDIHRSRAQCMLRLGDLAKKQGDLSRAVEFWKESRPLFERSAQAKDIAQIDARLGAVEQIIG
ncbi:hypothetical protein DFH08DRAFT_984664 [Mycena albidolilacea]|uniref:Novel STAND NTPase 1 domain-containing protein n=1 Tax=Mycena albidolilacea TaxID=1033008 RepID=A0AAD7EWT4_9AGAR|nr:hypothetical protein DFH08DRAFT_984664 [Mycena albidolilacea]